MRHLLQRNPITRLITAIVLAALVSSVVGMISSLPVAAGAFASLAALAFAALTVAPDAIALQRRHYWRWWWRTSQDEGPFWPGTRIPRHPRRPP